MPMQNAILVLSKITTSAHTRAEHHPGAVENYDECLYPCRTPSSCCRLRRVPIPVQNAILVPSKITTSAYTRAERHPGAVENYDECLCPCRMSSWCRRKLRRVPIPMQNNMSGAVKNYNECPYPCRTPSLVLSKTTTSAYTHAERHPGAVENYDECLYPCRTSSCCR